MDILFILLAAWTLYTIYRSIRVGAFIYIGILFFTYIFLSLFISSRNIKLFLSIILSNLFYAGIIITNLKFNGTLSLLDKK